MLDFSNVNIWAILVGWLVNVVIGAFWYSPAGFGKPWSKLSGVDIMKLPKDEANQAIIYVAIASIFQSAVLYIVLHSLHVTAIGDGLQIGLLLWLGLTAATTIGNTFYQRLGWKFWWINASFFLVTMALNSIIFSLWK